MEKQRYGCRTEGQREDEEMTEELKTLFDKTIDSMSELLIELWCLKTSDDREPIILENMIGILRGMRDILCKDEPKDEHHMMVK